MSLTEALRFECPYCMAYNDFDLDPVNDPGQQQILDCQICCQPIELTVLEEDGIYTLLPRRDDE